MAIILTVAIVLVISKIIFPKKNGDTSVGLTAIDPADLGTKWLSFCAYYQYPVGGLGAIWAAWGVPITNFPRAIVIALPIALTLFAISYGLHRRRMWAWKANWVVMVLAGIEFISEKSSEHVIVFLVAIFGIGIWLWFNFVYWTKRRGLFS